MGTDDLRGDDRGEDRIRKLIFLYGENGSYAHMFAGILAIVAVAYAADRAMVWFMHAALHWHDSADLAGQH